MVKSQLRLGQRIDMMLEETPGQSILELASKLGVNRTFLAGYLQALEDHRKVTSRKIGPAKVYFNGSDRSQDTKGEKGRRFNC